MKSYECSDEIDSESNCRLNLYENTLQFYGKFLRKNLYFGEILGSQYFCTSVLSFLELIDKLFSGKYLLQFNKYTIINLLTFYIRLNIVRSKLFLSSEYLDFYHKIFFYFPIM